MTPAADDMIDRDVEIVEHSKRLGERTAELLDRYLHRADDADQLAQIENLAGLLRSALAYNLALATEIAHYCSEMRQARAERDELLDGLAEGIAEACGAAS